MQENINFDSGTRAGTLGGTLLCIFCNIHFADLTKTAILAAVGAAVSFGVSIALKSLVKRFKR